MIYIAEKPFLQYKEKISLCLSSEIFSVSYNLASCSNPSPSSAPICVICGSLFLQCQHHAPHVHHLGVGYVEGAQGQCAPARV